jgi:hypothetical protein
MIALLVAAAKPPRRYEIVMENDVLAHLIEDVVGREIATLAECMDSEEDALRRLGVSIDTFSLKALRSQTMLIRRPSLPWPLAIARAYLYDLPRDAWGLGIFASPETQFKTHRRIRATRLMEQRANAKLEAAVRRKYFIERGRTMPTKARHFDGYYDSIALRRTRDVGQ